MTRYEWIEMSDMKEMCFSLIQKYPDKFQSLIVDRIKFIGILDAKPVRPGAKIWSLFVIQTPINEAVGTDVACIVNFDAWASCEEKSKALICASILSCLEWKDRIISKGHDLHDRKDMIANFGVDYESNPDSPDILNNNYNWRL